MAKVPREVGGCIALPINLPVRKSFPEQTKHYLYIRPHDPQIPDEDAPRSLFLVNIPVTATVQTLRHLFTTQLEGGRVESVHFAEKAPGQTSTAVTRSSRKRKRMTAEELEAGLDKYSLPKVFDSEIHGTGSTAIVVFVDRASMELTLKTARRAVKTGATIEWEDTAQSTSPRFGLTRYEHHKHLKFPSRKKLLRSVNGFMTAYAQMEEARSRENTRKRQMPDEDGFITVTRGSKGGARAEEIKELAEKHKEKNKGLEDFYRFQMREKRKEQHHKMLRKFEDDKRKVNEMRHRRGTLKVKI
ncbi:uncharacterized protein A1O9_06776 [Exophiala aquamarina CBS 119918]|uniref:Meiotic recombination protein DMC1 n=1 Tax=Exophiala aquamarina CBS 119918 TaxID=1182545 RepID=A0A072P9Z8_9EURO|nr:uncharacterized protein A1O9_06776 [Exophiala aquamarina CBS 119918]KEF56587.1 hypothetical protein A1O9_06776 [Exophiala aquamarina CBS 119918]